MFYMVSKNQSLKKQPKSSNLINFNVCVFMVRYDPSDDVWTELAPMASGRVLAGSVVHHGKIYVIGNELDYGQM